MATNLCPKSCSQLSVAAILIAIGIIQLLAGILLLKSEDIYLLAGTDFVVATSNILVGCLLGIAASVWNKKKKVFSLKNAARHNVLAGLYIASLSMNATAAIVMILGDGNKLLTTKDSTKYSGDLVFEILACAYVTSVCSPIVCLVISLVCLSGNRIRIFENMKKKDSLARKESYGWVFEKNQDNRSNNLGTLLNDPSSQNASASDDNVFVEKMTVSEKLKAKSSKKNKDKNSSSSLSEVMSPLEIWAHKRHKIIEEITSPKPIFFADDYLQFPEFKYGSYIGTMIPRITQTSFIKKSSRNSTLTTQAGYSENLEKMKKVDKTMSCKPSKSHLDELNFKLASRRMSYPEPGCFNTQMDCSEENLNALSEAAIEDMQKSIAATDFHTSLHRTHAKSMETLLKKECFNFEVAESPPTEGHDAMDSPSSLGYLDPYTLRQNSNDSSSSGLTAETISELKAKINRMNSDDDENVEQKPELFRSFKHEDKRKSHLSESDVEDQRSEFQKLHNQYGVFTQNTESGSRTVLAGEIVPISIRQMAINRADSIPLKTICSQAPSRYSVNIKNEISDQNLDASPDNAELLTHGVSRPNLGTNSSSSSYKEKSANQSNIESKGPERKLNFKRRMPSMGSIAESPTEEFLQIAQSSQSAKVESHGLSNSLPEVNKETDAPKNGIRHLGKSHSLRRLSLKAAPSLLNRLWSVKRTDTKTDLTSLIMDSDSLVGLSDDDLMARSRRLRQLRKSVELRSKTEKPIHAV